MDYQVFSDRINGLIGQNKLKEAIHEMQEVLKKSDRIKDIIIQSARYDSVMQQLHNGLIDFEQAELTQNKIRLALLHFLDEIEDQIKKDPSIESELSTPNTSTHIINKNVVKDSNISTTSGDIHIGDIN